MQDLVARFRDLPPEQQRRLPALWNSLAQLEIVIGDLDAGQQDFQEVARLVTDPISQAEAHHNVYRAALERRDWDDALASLRRAVALDPDAFEPFPLSRYEPKRILGAGGSGVSFLCRGSRRTRRRNRLAKVVVKTLRADSPRPRRRRPLPRGEVIQELDHPALIRVRRGCALGRRRTRRPALPGARILRGPIPGRVRRPPRPLRAGRLAGRSCWPIGRALQALHGRGILHRSLRPGRVLIRRDKNRDGQDAWRVKLLDAGLSLKRTVIHASASNPAACVHTGLGRSVARTIPFAPPEVVGRPKGQVWVGPHSDIYSFGKLCRLRPDRPARPRRRRPPLLPDAWQTTARRLHRLDDQPPAAHFGIVVDRMAQPPGARRPRRPQSSANCTNRPSPSSRPPSSRRPRGLRRPGQPGQRLRPAGRPRPGRRRLHRGPDSCSPTTPRLYRRRGLAHARSRRPRPGAIADYTESLRLEPRNLEALANRGLAHAQKQGTRPGHRRLYRSLHLNPRDESLYYNRGNAWYCKGDLDRADRRLHARRCVSIRATPGPSATAARPMRLRGDHARAVADFTRVLQLDPNNVKAVWDRACPASSSAGPTAPSPTTTPRSNWSRTPPCTTSAACATPPSAITSRPSPTSPRRWPSTGERRRLPVARRGPPRTSARFRQALADLDEALKLQPDSADALAQRGMVQFQSGAYAEAVADYTGALELKPDQAEVHFDRGVAHAGPRRSRRRRRRLHRGDTARRGRTRPCSPAGLRPPRRRVRQARRRRARPGRLRRGDTARSHRRRGVRPPRRRVRPAARPRQSDRRLYRGRPSQPVRRRLRWSRRGLRGSRRSGKGVGGLRRGCAARPAVGPRLFLRGHVHALRAEFDAAVADFTEALRLRPDHAAAHSNRAAVHARRGDLDQALADLNEAVRLEPGSAAALNNRGNVQRRRGDLDAALADYDAAVAVVPALTRPGSPPSSTATAPPPASNAAIPTGPWPTLRRPCG